MKLHSTLPLLLGLLTAATAASGQTAPEGVYREHSFYGDPPDEHHPWEVHDQNRPQPLIVTPGTYSSPGQPGKPPSDAIILYDGTDLSKWEADNARHEPTKWVIKDGAMECVPGSGYIKTKENIGDCQLHVEWASPTRVEGTSQGRGNSGVFLMGLVEVQVLDNYKNPTYADGMAGAVYGQHAPFANALLPPGQFQTYDIIFRRPLYGKDGQLAEAGYVTVFENGVVVQDHAIIEGETGHMARAKPSHFPDSGPLKLQDHGNPVRFRNIWYRLLPPRAAEGGDDGYLTSEATAAKRAQIAASLRADADKMTAPGQSLEQTLRYAESLCYASDDPTYQKVNTALLKYIADFQALPADTVNTKRNEVRQLRDVCNYLVKFKMVPSDFEPKAKFDQIIRDHNWDARRGRG
ncbi:MAG: DUF1080 domain-containing protein [Limisphaerales bacterium]